MRLGHIFFDVNMKNGHRGLVELMRVSKIKLGKGPVVFINKARTSLKMLTDEEVLLHLKRPINRPIDLDTIRYLPKCVEGGEILYTKALRISLERRLYNKDRK